MLYKVLDALRNALLLCRNPCFWIRRVSTQELSLHLGIDLGLFTIGSKPLELEALGVNDLKVYVFGFLEKGLTE